MSYDAGAVLRIGSKNDTSACFFDVNDAAADPTDVYLNFGVNGTFDIEAITPSFTWHFQPPATSLFGDIVRVGQGIYRADIDTTGRPGPWAARLWGVGTAQGSIVMEFDVSEAYTGWPFPYGYCGIDDLKARISNWTGDGETSFPLNRMANDFMRFAAAHIDSRLLAMGYTVPLTPQPNKTIMPQAWLVLRDLCAEYATGYTQRARTSESDVEDTDGMFHLGLADDMLAMLENGDINLSAFNVAGPFMPVLDKSLGILGQPSTDALGNTYDRGITLNRTII